MDKTPILTDYFVVCTANSSTHMGALREMIIDELEKNEFKIIFYDRGKEYSWLVVDGGEVVFHIFTEKGRKFYSLENLWIAAGRVNFKNRSKGTA